MSPMVIGTQRRKVRIAALLFIDCSGTAILGILEDTLSNPGQITAPGL